MLHSFQDFFIKYAKQIRTSFKWIGFAAIVGIVLGLVGSLFHYCVDLASVIRGEYPWLIWLLPGGGLLIVFLYHVLHNEKDTGTNLVLSSIYTNEHIPLRMAPLIFISTCITHLFGGSAGREGAALQLGGSISQGIGKLFRFNENDQKIMVMCGMSAAFSALFGTPLASAVFSLEVVSVGIMQYSALVPCVISSLIAYEIALQFGLAPESFQLTELPAFNINSAVLIGILAILCGFVSILFCIMLHQADRAYRKFFQNPYIRILVSGAIVIALTFVVGNQDYNGSGMVLIERCILTGSIFPLAFLLKMVFTAATLGGGYKGGEIIPSLTVGATFGCLFGSLVGFDPSLCAAVGMGAVFCGVTNSPITSLLICFELFGFNGMPYYVIAIAISYMFSGYYGLYSSQKIMYSKYRTEYINKKTNQL